MKKKHLVHGAIFALVYGVVTIALGQRALISSLWLSVPMIFVAATTGSMLGAKRHSD